MAYSRKISLFAVLLIACVGIVAAQAQKADIQVTLDHPDWIYQVAEPASFILNATIDGQPLREGKVKWNVGPEKMPLFFTGEASYQPGLVIKSHGLDHPGFLQCQVQVDADGKSYKGLATAAYEPLKIQPTTPLPDDFMTFWQAELKKAHEIPIDAKLEKDEQKSDDKVDVYQASYQNIGGSRMYGMLVVPKGDGPFPALLQVPGAGIRPYNGEKGWGEKGVIHFQIGIHGIPVNLPQRVYDDLQRGALSGYQAFNLESRDAYYYKRVILGAVRAVDFLNTLDKFDKKSLAIHGGSQGGALSIITASLDERIKYLAAEYPAMSDHFGYLEHRAGGWPHLFADPQNRTPEKLKTAQYYDVVNFARFIKVPVFYGLGFNDTVCPPTSMFSVYNVISSPKEIKLFQPRGHEWIKEYDAVAYDWLLKKLNP